jgi:ditrans,polycis-polyprenyl diphosphate synthase
MGLLRWLHAKALALARRCVLAVLAAGPLPAHVAFVMDGNRRYARARGRAVGDGHAAGFRALERVLEACLRLDVRCVSVYAFSLENFARPEREVQTLMDLAEAKLRALARRGALLHKYGARLNVCGRVELLPERVQRAVREAEELTKHNTHAVLNLCMPYTSRDEIATAVQTTVRDAVDRGLDPAYDPLPFFLFYQLVDRSAQDDLRR